MDAMLSVTFQAGPKEAGKQKQAAQLKKSPSEKNTYRSG